MKHLKKILLLLLAINNCGYSQSTKSYVLEGNIKGIGDGTTIYLITRDLDTVSKAEVIDEKFVMRGKVEKQANFYFLMLDTSILEKKKNISNALWLVNSNLNVFGDVNQFKNLDLRGSIPQIDYQEWMKYTRGRMTIDSVPFFVNYIKTHSNSFFIPYALINLKRLTLNFPTAKSILDDHTFLNLYNNLSNEVKSSYWGIELLKVMDAIHQQSIMAKMNVLPDFKIQGPDGRIKSVLELASRSKYTLLDFWASWCSPCRAAIPKLTHTYNSFKSNGFNIIGVSTDKSELAWKKALVNDKTPWLHGIDNVEHVSKNVFMLAGVPAYILIDQNGRVIQSEYYSTNNIAQKQTFNDKRLSNDLYEIVEQLIKKENGKH